MPAFIARAASKTSGTKMRLCLKSSPTTRMPAMSPSSSTSATGRSLGESVYRHLLDDLVLPLEEQLVHFGVVDHGFYSNAGS